MTPGTKEVILASNAETREDVRKLVALIQNGKSANIRVESAQVQIQRLDRTIAACQGEWPNRIVDLEKQAERLTVYLTTMAFLACTFSLLL